MKNDWFPDIINNWGSYANYTPYTPMQEYTCGISNFDEKGYFISGAISNLVYN